VKPSTFSRLFAERTQCLCLRACLRKLSHARPERGVREHKRLEALRERLGGRAERKREDLEEECCHAPASDGPAQAVAGPQTAHITHSLSCLRKCS